MSSLVESMNKELPLDQEKYSQAEAEDKFTMLSDAITTENNRFALVHDIVNNASDGLDPRQTDCEERILHLTD